MLTGKDIDKKFDSLKCKKCTAKAANKFTSQYDKSVAYFRNEYEQVGVLRTVRFDEELHGQIEVQCEAVKDITWQDRAFQSRYDGQYSDKLPPHRSFDDAIDMVDGKEPPWGPINALLEKELGVLREYLDTILASGKIRSSKSATGALILFFPKREGTGLRLCVDYRGLNKVTILNRYPLPLKNELRDPVGSSTIFTKLDHKSGYNLIRIKEGDK